MKTQRELDCQDWLNRMYNTARLIESLETKRDTVIESMSGIGKYDSEFIPAQTGENSTETKNLLYSQLSAEIDKNQTKLLIEDARTLKVILMLDDSPRGQLMQAVLIDRYLSRMPWKKISSKHNYSPSGIYKVHEEAIRKVSPYIPKEVIVYD